jgi:hypothetical protein
MTNINFVVFLFTSCLPDVKKHTARLQVVRAVLHLWSLALAKSSVQSRTQTTDLPWSPNEEQLQPTRGGYSPRSDNELLVVAPMAMPAFAKTPTKP